MVEYKIVKYCRMCKKRYTIKNGEIKRNYCTECLLKLKEE